MAELDAKSKKLAKRLAVTVAAAGKDISGQVGPAFERLLGDRPLAERRSFIKAFLRFLERELRARRLLVEHVGVLSPADLERIVQRFGGDAAAALTVVPQETPSLLGGIRVTFGDNVYDASVAGRLARLGHPAS